MEFPYLKVVDFPKHQKRERFLPWIRFGIFNPKNKSKILYPVGLVDSGSDITIIDHEFAKELGIEIKKGPNESFPLTMPQQTAILGTIGFFRHFKVTFDYPRRILVESK